MTAPVSRWSWRGVLTMARQLPRRVLVLVIRFYQRFVSPMTPPTCRFYPSCSQYAVIALERHGLIRGTWLAARRLLRCNPWNPGGVDDVPPAGERRAHLHRAVPTAH